MGKSLVPCAVCGKMLHEEDFARRKAVDIENRTYCSDCAPLELQPEPPPKPEPPRPAASSRPAAQSTRRIPAALPPRKSRLPLALGIAAGVLLAAAGVIALSRRSERPRVEEPAKAAQRPAEPRPAPPPIAESKKDPVAPIAPLPPPEPAKEAKAIPAPAPEKATSPRPTITFPADGAVFDAPASITITVEVPGDGVLVEVFDGASKIGEAAQRPYSIRWTDVAPGDYRLTARATEKGGEPSPSTPVTVRVVAVVAAVPELKKPAPAPAPVDPNEVDSKRIDEAIAKGAAFLKATAVKESIALDGLRGYGECPELILWTFVHARVPENDPDFVKLFNYVLSRKLERTYAVALQAMILEEVNRVKYQTRIAQCAQFLLDGQCQNGQWSYTGPAQSGVPTTALKPDVATSEKAAVFDAAGARLKPKVVRKITTVRKMQEGGPTGDNSNSQYAALGLRACSDAGIVIPKAVIQRAQTWWRISQHEEEEKRPGVATGEVSAGPAGWCYGPKDHGHNAYASMTAGAVGSVAIWNYLQDEKAGAKDPTLQKGLAWLERHFSVKSNEGPDEHAKDTKWMVFYYLYALERAGILANTETFGAHRWYPEGAKWILAQQRGDGSWLGPLPHGDRSEGANAAWDTCFAILFLKRATRPLVASTDAKGK